MCTIKRCFPLVAPKASRGNIEERDDTVPVTFSKLPSPSLLILESRIRQNLGMYNVSSRATARSVS